ncbi:MAG: hypothetical protein RI980_275 [Bacteroidota bacterium]|jgi:hypothetical protein
MLEFFCLIYFYFFELKIFQKKALVNLIQQI